MKRALLMAGLIAGLVAAIAVLLWLWIPAPEPSRFTGPVLRLGLKPDFEVDAGLPLVLRASVTSPRAQAALGAREEAGFDLVIGSRRAGWWERLELLHSAGGRWTPVPFAELGPRGPDSLDLAAGESGFAFVMVRPSEWEAGQYKIRMTAAGETFESKPLAVERKDTLDEFRRTQYQAEAALRSGEPQRALDIVASLGESSSVFADSLTARAHEDLGQWGQALEAWERAATRSLSGDEPPHVALDGMARARQALEQGVAQ